MRIYTTYSVKIKHYNHISKDTVAIYRRAVDYLIAVCIDKWDTVVTFKGQSRLTYIESLVMPRRIIRVLKSLDESSRLAIEAKVPQSAKRSTCTFSTLISLNAELMSLVA